MGVRKTLYSMDKIGKFSSGYDTPSDPSGYDEPSEYEGYEDGNRLMTHRQQATAGKVQNKALRSDSKADSKSKRVHKLTNLIDHLESDVEGLQSALRTLRAATDQYIAQSHYNHLVQC